MPSSTSHIFVDSFPYKCWCGIKLHGPMKVYGPDKYDTYEYKECSNCLTFYVRQMDGSDNGGV